MDLSIIGKKSEPKIFEYTWRDAILYALGIGAQTDESSFVYENAPGGLKVIPSFGTLAPPLPWESIRSLKLEPGRVIHGEHLLRLHRPIPPEGRLVTVSEVPNIYDKGKAAIIILWMETRTESGEPVFDSEALLYYLGGGGFGGDSGPKSRLQRPPKGVAPDFQVAYSIPENQAALYRLSGDFNPLHIDPDVAKAAGFDKPILHGLCTFGYATRAIVHGACDGDVTRFKELRVRFAAPVYPGETLITEGWQTGEERYIIRGRTDRVTVLTNAYALVTA